MDAIITYRENLMKSTEEITRISVLNPINTGCRIQDQYTKTNMFLLLTMSNQKLNLKIILFILVKIYKLLKDKSDKIYAKPT